MFGLENKRLFLFDIDGTLAVGEDLFEGTRRLLEYIDHIGGKAFYITNNSTRSGKDYVKKFEKWGIRTEEEQFVTSGYMAKDYLKKHCADRQIFVLGTASFVQELRSCGLDITEEVTPCVSCVLAAYDSELTYRKLERACELLVRPDVEYLATNPDLCCPAPFGFIPDCGAICNMLEASTGRVPRYLGKPSAQVVELCLERSGISKEETLVVGDRLYTDIACGIAAGVETCVVFTGEADRKDIVHTPYFPDYCVENVGELLDKCIDVYTIV